MAEQQKRVSREQKQDHETSFEADHEQRELIRSKLEEAEKKHIEKRSKGDALEEATALAEKADKTREEQEQPETGPKEKLRGAPSKKQLAKTFDTQMKGIQTEMDGGGKLFSKLIHLRVVEKTSNAVGATIARPNAMLSGSIAAFITITAIYFIARHYGYHLSGFETIAAFILGWVLGILYDYVASLVGSRRR